MAATNARAIGDKTRALQLWGQIVEQDPLSPIYRRNYATYLLAADRLEDARTQLVKLFELNPAAGPDVTIDLVRVLTLMKRYDEAEALIAQLPEGEFRDFALALQYHAPGRRAEAGAALDRLRGETADVYSFVRLAEIYAYRGMNEDAFAVLQRQRALLDDEPSSSSYRLTYFIGEIDASRLLRPLHNDPRWAVLITRPG